ncbi:MAG: hypothetical protein P9E67_04880 [Candidatus Competibacter sp.]|nr:hypothetical protein [Candidatus Competibacter sp.]
MAQTTLIFGDAGDFKRSAGLIFTDPPYDMPGARLAQILGNYDAPHLVLITTMRQLLDFMPRTDWRLAFDFVIDGVMPKQSKSLRQPNYIHQTGVYLTRPGAKSVFDRKRRQRSDVFEGNGYWPTIFHAPRNQVQQHGHAKNHDAMTDLLGSFDVASVIDPFAGSGSTAFAAFELEIPCTAIEKDPATFAELKKSLRFMNHYIGAMEVIE